MDISNALDKFRLILEKELARAARLKEEGDFLDYSTISPIVVGVVGGDGIGPMITRHTNYVLEELLENEVKQGEVSFRFIDGLTIENRSKEKRPVPLDVLAEIKECHVLLKGPTTTPRAGDKWANIESANVALRKELDLFANVRPIRVPEEGIDWTFFRENTEGSYVLGSDGFHFTDETAFDFVVATTTGTERIVKAAFEFARKAKKRRVTAVTKANVIKTTDGKFLQICKEISQEYPEIEFDDWYVDIMAAKLLDKNRRSDFQVFVLPNLYGDILTDEAAEIQGGMGTAGSANIGKKYAMFEAVHGSALRMVEEGRTKYADPTSTMRAAAMLLSHIGFHNKAARLDAALDYCTGPERELVVTGRSDGATTEEFTEYVLDTLKYITVRKAG
ncbi:MAG TPA: isocitrate/isopropylmalate dehydrogenase family protein [Firmicutes bacterium]|nr:isocitrate/isopropylmalate dehydrogenase family protein [Bacillota bacterium]